MANMNSEILIKTSEYRPCIVKGKKAIFHRWEEKQKNDKLTLSEIIKETVGIVEFEDGKVKEVFPPHIKFCDNKIDEYYFSEEEQCESNNNR